MTKQSYYINGNTVRELHEVEPVRRERKTRREIEQARRKKNRRNAVRRNRERAMGMNFAYVTFLSCCVIATAFAATTLIKMQSSITQRMKNVAALESQIADMKADNDARYKEISTSIDLNHIKEVAMKDLGMKYATKDQIVYYSVEHNNYMDQYSDIPQ